NTVRSKTVTLSWLLNQPQWRQTLPTWESIQKLCPPGTAIVTWHLSPAALTTVLVHPGASEPIVLGRTPNVVLNVVLSPSLRARVNSARQDSDASLDILLELLGLTGENEVAAAPAPAAEANSIDEIADARDRRQRLTAWLAQWQAQLTTMTTTANLLRWSDLLAQLGEILNFDALSRELVQGGVEKVLLMPHQELRGLPLHALFPENLTVAYLGALPLALSNQAWLPEQTPTDWAVRPTGTLPVAGDRSLLSLAGASHIATADPENTPPPAPAGADIEAAAVCQYCGTFTHLAGTQASAAEVKTAFADGHHLLHYVGAYANNPATPQQSALQLNEHERLSGRDWDDLPWADYYLASFTLPATPLGQPTAADHPDWATLLLSRGVSYVLSALWTLNPEARLILTVEFYRRFLAGTRPPQALQQTQHWLRRAQPSDLAQWYRERAAELTEAPGQLAPEFQAAAERWQAAVLQQHR
ncbi:MAG: CHAT domain-containing protein, partial [Spirulinaceae cyanobacterium RM2_2_10]|nr:CHAT domain-containing protein [Spirulinaceae cyanobacterium RM2_2_10]